MRRRRWQWWISLLGLVVFVVIAWQVETSDSPLLDFDRRCALAMQEDAAEHSAHLHFFRLITHAGGVPMMTGVAIVGALLCRPWRLALVWLLVPALGGGIDLMVKTCIARPRPSAELRDAAVTEFNASYPSGHSMGSVIGYGLVAYVGVLTLRRRWQKVVLIAVLTGLVLVIGLSRIYLRAHWCSDVLGGYAIGVCWITACVSALDWSRAPPARPPITP